jgi:phosphohistidine phosphatase
MRHCKSRWDQADVGDIDRKLSPRGKRDARAMGSELGKDESLPDLVVTSIARRARSTAKRVAKTWGYTGQVQIDERLYEGTRQGCLTLLREIDDSIHALVLVGHNPHLEEMVFLLGDRAVPLSTGTCVRIDLVLEHWADLQLPAGGCVRRVRQVASEAR